MALTISLIGILAMAGMQTNSICHSSFDDSGSDSVEEEVPGIN